MITALLLLFPLLASVFLLIFKGEMVKKVAFAAAIIELGLSIWIWVSYCSTCPSSKEALMIDTPWITSLGIHFALQLDGISLILVLLTNFLIPLIILSTFKHSYDRPSTFYGLVLAMQVGLLGVFMAYDAFLFYVFWEVALIPVYFISALYGGKRRIEVTLKFFIYTILGSLFMLIGVIYLYLQTPNGHSFSWVAFQALDLSPEVQGIVFLAFFLAFAIKMPIFPFHTWQPDTYTESSAAGTMLLSGIMLKMGIFGVIRWIIPILPLGFMKWDDVVIVLSVIGIVYASIIAIQQKDAKRLVAYSSIAHVGLIAAGLFAANEISLQGVVIQMLNHGVNVVGMFVILDIIESRTKTRDISSLGGIATKAPKLAVLFLVILLGNVALPLTNGFVGEFLLLNGLFVYNTYLAAIAGLTIILGAVYMLRTFQKVMLGNVNSVTEDFKDLTTSEISVLIPIVAVILVVGIYPSIITDLSALDVKALVEVLK